MLTEIEARERAGVVLQGSQNRPKKDQYTGATLTTRTHNKVWENHKECCYCQGNHEPNDCRARHHPSICRKHFEELSQVNLQVQEIDLLNPSAAPFTPTLSATVATQTVLLQLAKGSIFNLSKPAFQREVKVILDCVAQGV